MKRTLYFSSILIGLLFFLAAFNGCQKEKEFVESETIIAEDPADPINEDIGIIYSEEELLEQALGAAKFKATTHDDIAYLSAIKMGLSTTRANIIKGAAHMPDVYQSGVDGKFNQQWSHAFIQNNNSAWLWGDADDDFHDNINGDSGELESPEGYNGLSAAYYYNKGDKNMGDWYLGYALHYMADVNFTLHSSDPSVAMLLHHFDYEAWISNNWTTGHKLKQYAEAVNTYYTVTNLKTAIDLASTKANCWKSTNTAYLAWNAYVTDKYPTASGTGSPALVTNTKKMVEESMKWSMGTIKYTLDKYKKW